MLRVRTLLTSKEKNVMKLAILGCGTMAYLAFLATILYLIGFVAGIVVPKHIDSGVPDAVPFAVLTDIALILLFGLTHSLMARPAFKKCFCKIINPALERSTFVMVANIVFAILFWQWRPINGLIWSSSGILSSLLFAVSVLGWMLVFWSTFLIDHFDLFGMRQVWLYYRGIEYNAQPFIVRGLYKYVRHPLMLGFLLAFWFTPTMTAGHLLFAIAMTIYIFVGVRIEERDLAEALGQNHSCYQAATPMIIPGLRSLTD